MKKYLSSQVIGITKQNKEPNLIKETINPMERKRNTDDLKTLRGWHIFHKSSNPMNPVKTTEIVEYIFWGISKTDFAKKHNKTLMQTVMAVGIDTLIMFENNDFFIGSEFGSNANKNEGIPTVKQFNNVICAGSNG